MRELDCTRYPAAVRIIQDLARGLIVDDPIIAIERAVVDAKLIGADDIAGCERREDGAVKPEDVVGAVEVSDGIDIGRGVERGVEQELVLRTEKGVRISLPAPPLSRSLPAPPNSWSLPSPP